MILLFCSVHATSIACMSVCLAWERDSATPVKCFFSNMESFSPLEPGA